MEVAIGTKKGKKSRDRPAHLTSVCTAFHGGPRIPVSDSGKSVRLFSTSGLFVSRADGCLHRQQTACDFVVTDPTYGDLFVELKGSDVERAVDQIDATIAEWRRAGWVGKVFGGLIVCTRYPRQDSKIQRMRNRFARDYKAALHVVRHGQEFDFLRTLAIDGPR